MFNFFKKNIIFLFIFLFFLTFFLFFYKYSFTTTQPNLTLLKYEKIIKKINLNKSESLNEAETFIMQNNNIYGILTSIFLAKEYISHNNLNKAFIQLSNSLKYTKEENLKNIIKIRMTKIKIQKKENKEALSILKSIKNHNWDSVIENIKGDIFMNKKNKKLAIKSWKKSLSLEKSNASKEIINMKINELK